MTLAAHAFRELPEHYSRRQAITRFCQGLLDKNVASQVSSKVPATIEEAINNAKWCQHVHQTVYGKEKPRQSESDSDDTYNVMQVSGRGQQPVTQSNSAVAPLITSVEKMLTDFRREI